MDDALLDASRRLRVKSDPIPSEIMTHLSALCGLVGMKVELKA